MAGRPKAFDPDAALDRALDLFWTRGYEATSVQALQDAMDIGRQSLYDTFGGKRALYHQALRHYDRWRLDQLREHFRQPGSPLAHVESLVRFWGSAASVQPFRGCLIHNTIVELGQHDREWADVTRGHLQEVESMFAEALRAAHADGTLSTSVDPRRQARAIVATFLGLMALGKMAAEAAVIDDVVESALAPLAG